MDRASLGFNEAAGIPRGRPPGCAGMPSTTPGFNEAAGIPRGRPTPPLRDRRSSRCFNEAAGIPRGRPRRRGASWSRRPVASMRPRVFPAEDGISGDCDVSRCYFFGKTTPAGFNEAAGIPRGRPVDRRAVQVLIPASVSPRVFPAEDEPGPDADADLPLASMRPRVFPAEDSCAAGTRTVA